MDVMTELLAALKTGMRTAKFGWMEESAIKRALHAFDHLETQSMRGVTQGMVCVPEVEWDAIFRVVPGGSGVPNCKHCGGAIEIRNPTGNCDHIYWPENLTEEAKRANGILATATKNGA
jgi:hypothetical protein